MIGVALACSSALSPLSQLLRLLAALIAPLFQLLSLPGLASLCLSNYQFWSLCLLFLGFYSLHVYLFCSDGSIVTILIHWIHPLSHSSFALHLSPPCSPFSPHPPLSHPPSLVSSLNSCVFSYLFILSTGEAYSLLNIREWSRGVRLKWWCVCPPRCSLSQGSSATSPGSTLTPSSLSVPLSSLRNRTLIRSVGSLGQCLLLGDPLQAGIMPTSLHFIHYYFFHSSMNLIFN